MFIFAEKVDFFVYLFVFPRRTWPRETAMVNQGWASNSRASSLATDALGVLLEHRGEVGHMFVCPGRSISSLYPKQKKEQQRSRSVADFRAEEDKPDKRITMDALPVNDQAGKWLKKTKLFFRQPTPYVCDFLYKYSTPAGNTGRKKNIAGNATVFAKSQRTETGRAAHSMSVDLNANSSSPVPASQVRFVGHEQCPKFGRSWGKYNPVHLPVVDGVSDVENELAKPNFGCRTLLCASKMDLAKFSDRVSGNMCVRDKRGTLHSSLSYSAYDPYGRYKNTFDPDWSGRLGGEPEGDACNPADVPARTLADSSCSSSKPKLDDSRRKRLHGKGNMLVHIPAEGKGEAAARIYNLTDPVACGTLQQQILYSTAMAFRLYMAC